MGGAGSDTFRGDEPNPLVAASMGRGTLRRTGRVVYGGAVGGGRGGGGGVGGRWGVGGVWGRPAEPAGRRQNWAWRPVSYRQGPVRWRLWLWGWRARRLRRSTKRHCRERRQRMAASRRPHSRRPRIFSLRRDDGGCGSGGGGGGSAGGASAGGESDRRRWSCAGGEDGAPGMTLVGGLPTCSGVAGAEAAATAVARRSASAVRVCRYSRYRAVAVTASNWRGWRRTRRGRVYVAEAVGGGHGRDQRRSALPLTGRG